MKSLLTILFCTWCFAFSFAQEVKKSSKTETIDGKKYYIHIVEKGQTLYSICKVYDISQNDLVYENPELMNGLKPDQKIKIPVKGAPVQAKPDEVKYNGLTHTVEKGETFYSISKKYQLSADSLQKANPGFEKLKKGDVLRIPSAAAVKAPEVQPMVEKTVNGNEIYNVGLFLPLYLSKNDSADIYENKDKEKTIYPKSIPAVEFYEGFLSAIDSLKKAGVNCNLMVYDIPTDSLQILSFLKKPELKELNLIIGPFHSDDVSLVAAFAKANKIMMIAPFSQSSKALLGNPYLCKATPSGSTQVEQLAQFVCANFKTENIIVAHNNLTKEKTAVEVFKNKANRLLEKDTVKVIVYRTVGLKGLTALLSHDKNNVIFVPSNDQAFVTDLLNKLNGLAKDYRITLIGMESWIGYENLEVNTLQNLQLHIPANNYVDYSSVAVKDFIHQFRDTYKTEPGRFAYEGYDIALYHLAALKKFGITFPDKSAENKSNSLNTQFQYFKTGPESGYENQKVFILKYLDYSLIPAN